MAMLVTFKRFSTTSSSQESQTLASTSVSTRKLGACVQHVRVRHVNRVARKFYGAETDQQLLTAPPTLFDDTALDAFCQKLAALCRRCQHHCSLTLLKGDTWSSL